MADLTAERAFRSLHAIAAGSVLLWASAGAEAQGTHLRSGVDLVALNVAVHERGGRSASWLAADDFEVVEDGRRRAIAHFSRQRVPLMLTLLLDNSGSMAPHIDDAKEVARALLELLQPGDRGAIVDSSGAVRQPPTDDISVLQSALSGLAARGTTSLYDGMWRAGELISAQAPARDARWQSLLVVISDGGDTSSVRTLSEAVALIRSTGTVVHAVRPARHEAVGARIGRHIERHQLRVLKYAASATGGNLIPHSVAPGAAGTVRTRVARGLSSTYLLAYAADTPPQPDAHVTVRLKNRALRIVTWRLLDPQHRGSSD